VRLVPPGTRWIADAAPRRRGAGGAASRAGWAGFLAARGAVGAVLESAAALHRRRLPSTTFIGVTGSAGKTTTKDLIAAVLSTRFDGVRSRGGRNNLLGVIRTVAETRRRHRWCVQELGTWGPGSLRRSVALFRPDVSVVTVVGGDHWSAFRSLDAVAREKATLVEALGPEGAAVLNADDERVLAMAQRCAGRVVTFGRSPGADVRAEDVRGAWPDRLSLTVVADGGARPVRTRLVGEHWTPSVLAAIAVGRLLGVPLDGAAGALACVESAPGRMSVHERSDGVVFLRDDRKAPLWSIPQSFEVLARARAARRIAVVGSISDKSGRNDERYRQVARRALAAADEVVFVGPNARLARPAARGADESRFRAFAALADARRFLDGFLVNGDLVLLKGTWKTDHLADLLSGAGERRRSSDARSASGDRTAEVKPC
jgi:UDP-N-acetylmuramyl pentapeptide synthase